MSLGIDEYYYLILIASNTCLSQSLKLLKVAVCFCKFDLIANKMMFYF